MNIGFYVGAAKKGATSGAAAFTSRLASELLAHEFSSELSLHMIASDIATRRSSILARAKSRIADSLDVLIRTGSIESRTRYRRNAAKVFRKFDVIHFPFLTPPPEIGNCPFVITMHDVQEIKFPEYFNSEERALRAVEHHFAVRHAKAIVVSFPHVKEDLLRYFSLDENQVHVVPLPYRQCMLPEPDEQQQKVYANRHKGLGNFILYPAVTWEHKNHIKLIEAFEIARKRSKLSFNLVCAGVKSKFYFDVIQKRVEKSPCRASIFFTGELGPPWEQELRWLYERSIGVVIPTLYEAGSFPLIEAMSLAVPVVCAKTTSLPQTIGDDRFLFSPSSENEIAQFILQLVDDQDFRAANRENSARQMAKYKNINIGELYEKLWSNVLRKR